MTQPIITVRNFSNSQSANLTEDWGGCIRYRGFVHTASSARSLSVVGPRRGLDQVKIASRFAPSSK